LRAKQQDGNKLRLKFGYDTNIKFKNIFETVIA
jgi:hypothetical protein